MTFEPRYTRVRVTEATAFYGKFKILSNVQREVYKLILQNTYHRNSTRFFQRLGKIAVHVQDL